MVLKMIVRIKRLRKDFGIYVTHEEEENIYMTAEKIKGSDFTHRIKFILLVY